MFVFFKEAFYVNSALFFCIGLVLADTKPKISVSDVKKVDHSVPRFFTKNNLCFHISSMLFHSSKSLNKY